MTTEASQSQWPSMEEPEKGESPTNLSVETASVGSVDSVTPSPTPQPVQTQKVGTAEACTRILRLPAISLSLLSRSLLM